MTISHYTLIPEASNVRPPPRFNAYDPLCSESRHSSAELVMPLPHYFAFTLCYREACIQDMFSAGCLRRCHLHNERASIGNDVTSGLSTDLNHSRSTGCFATELFMIDHLDSSILFGQSHFRLKTCFDGMIGLKDLINFFQISSFGFHKEEIDDHYPEGIPDNIEDVEPPSAVCNGYWWNIRVKDIDAIHHEVHVSQTFGPSVER